MYHIRNFILAMGLFTAVCTLGSNRDTEWFECRRGNVCPTFNYKYLQIIKVSAAEFHAVVNDFISIQVDGRGCSVIVEDSAKSFRFNRLCGLRMKLINGYTGDAAVGFGGNWSFRILKRDVADRTTDHIGFDGWSPSAPIRLGAGVTRRIGHSFDMLFGFDDEEFHIDTNWRAQSAEFVFDDRGLFESLGL